MAAYFLIKGLQTVTAAIQEKQSLPFMVHPALKLARPTTPIAMLPNARKSKIIFLSIKIANAIANLTKLLKSPY